MDSSWLALLGCLGAVFDISYAGVTPQTLTTSDPNTVSQKTKESLRNTHLYEYNLPDDKDTTTATLHELMVKYNVAQIDALNEVLTQDIDETDWTLPPYYIYEEVEAITAILPPNPATPENVAKAKTTVSTQEAGGDNSESDNSTVGETNPTRYIRSITEKNSGDNKGSIYSLSFGSDTNIDVLRKCFFHTQKNCRNIYEDKDAAHQLQNSYNQAASQLNIHNSHPKKQVRKIHKTSP